MMTNNLNEIVSTRVKEYRARFNLTQEALAEMLDISQSHYTKLENGQRLPSLKVLYSLAQVFGVKMGDLVDINTTAVEPKFVVKENIMFMLNNKPLSELKIVEHMVQTLLNDLSDFSTEQNTENIIGENKI